MDFAWISGFWSGNSGVAHHQTWIASSTDRHGTNWVLSTDQRNRYRSQGVSRESSFQEAASSAYLLNRYRMSINTGYYGTDDSSDFAIAEIIVFDYELTPKQYKCVEDYLSEKYNITLEKTECLNDSLINQGLQEYNSCNLTDYRLLAWYDGASYDDDDNVWYDKSGNCYNVDSNYIGNTITKQNAGYEYISGTTSTTITFPFEILPLEVVYPYYIVFLFSEPLIYNCN